MDGWRTSVYTHTHTHIHFLYCLLFQHLLYITCIGINPLIHIWIIPCLTLYMHYLQINAVKINLTRRVLIWATVTAEKSYAIVCRVPDVHSFLPCQQEWGVLMQIFKGVVLHSAIFYQAISTSSSNKGLSSPFSFSFSFIVSWTMYQSYRSHQLKDRQALQRMRIMIPIMIPTRLWMKHLHQDDRVVPIR